MVLWEVLVMWHQYLWTLLNQFPSIFCAFCRAHQGDSFDTLITPIRPLIPSSSSHPFSTIFGFIPDAFLLPIPPVLGSNESSLQPLSIAPTRVSARPFVLEIFAFSSLLSPLPSFTCSLFSCVHTLGSCHPFPRILVPLMTPVPVPIQPIPGRGT
jgi:hypothetical protein